MAVIVFSIIVFTLTYARYEKQKEDTVSNFEERVEKND